MARKEKNIHYIYKTTCNVTGRWYVGMHSTNNLDDGYMGSGTVLRRSIRKYGVENHTKEILEFLPTREALIIREREIINKELIGDGRCMNLKEGGDGGFISEEQQRHRSKCGNKRLNELLKNDSHFKLEWLNKMKQGVKNSYSNGRKLNLPCWENKKHSEETKQLMSEKRKGTGVGEQNSQYGTMWIHCKASGEVKKIKKEDWFSYLIKSDCVWEQGRK
ncbi:MAG: hypothetical protein E6R13_08805 [Spirochaetes bacterium]|nr:MAG: hypothetical protein E6R13_08805 [Spirochaetota bacterium]